jgi:hypothetical protein
MGRELLNAHRQKMLRVLVVTLSLVLLGLLLLSWYLQAGQRRTCQVGFQPLDPQNGYLELRINQQHPVEPSFQGELFVLSVSPGDAQKKSVILRRSAEGTYASSLLAIPLIWDQPLGVLRSQTAQPFDIIRRSGSHQHFPFDSAEFSLGLSITPPLDLKVIRFVNQVPGFVLYCRECQATKDSEGILHLKFSLHRSPLIQVYVVVLFLASVIFCFLLLRLRNVESLAVAVASFFLSLWSLRGIIGSEIKTFPTLFDYGLLTVAVLLMLGLLWRLSGKKRP